MEGTFTGNLIENPYVAWLETRLTRQWFFGVYGSPKIHPLTETSPAAYLPTTALAPRAVARHWQPWEAT